MRPAINLILLCEIQSILLRYVPTDHGAALADDDAEATFLTIAYDAIAGGNSMSRVFDRFMGSYVLLERQNLEEMLGKLSQEEDIADSSNGSQGDVDLFFCFSYFGYIPLCL